MQSATLFLSTALLSLQGGVRAAGTDEWPLAGTTWKAADIASVTLSDDSSHPVTLSFGDGGVSGSAGCNEYFGSVEALPSSSFHTHGIASTKMYCGADGVMEQEEGYMRFLSSKTFFYEDKGLGELILFESTGSDGEPARGGAVARFVKDDGDAQGETSS